MTHIKPWEDTTPPRLERAHMITQVVQLRQQGKKIKEIAGQLGISAATVYNYLIEAMTELALARQQSSEEYLERDWAATDLLLEKYLPLAASGNDKAFEKVMALLERRAKYRGLDAPTKTEQRSIVFGDRFLTKEELQVALVNKLRERRACLGLDSQAQEVVHDGTENGATDPDLQETAEDSRGMGAGHEPSESR